MNSSSLSSGAQTMAPLSSGNLLLVASLFLDKMFVFDNISSMLSPVDSLLNLLVMSQLFSSFFGLFQVFLLLEFQNSGSQILDLGLALDESLLLGS